MTLARRAEPLRRHGEFAKARALAEDHDLLQRSRAARTVTNHARDAHDCSQLLSILGLDGEPSRDDRAAH